MNTDLFISDKDTLDDLIASQKHIENTYNIFAGECINPKLKSDVLNVLLDEHRIQSDLLNATLSRGWFVTKLADGQQVSQVKQKFLSMQ
ncbi:MAG: spore coat protein [Clostridiales bacterium]|nr:spore coat protein [Clostridiales bacterium]